MAQRPGVTQVFTQAIWESGGRPPGTGPLGRALQTAATVGWSPREGWWCWDVPGQEHRLHFVREPLRQVQQGSETAFAAISRASLRRGARLPSAGWADGPACRAAMRAASTELERSLLRGLMDGALWTAAAVSGHGTRTNSACPHCGAAHEDEVHVLWDSPEWESAKETWCHWLSDAATAIPHLGPLDQWPSCLRKAGLFPLRLAQGVDRGLLAEFLYRLYGMYLAVLVARMAASHGDQPGHGDSLFLDPPRPRPRTPTPGTTSSAPYRGTRSANSHGSGRGPRQAGGGPGTSSRT